MSRAASLVFAIVCYAIFFATFLYLISFVGDLSFAPVTVNFGGPESPPLVAAVVDIVLIALFGVQHSIMARQGFKRWWTQFVPWPTERSVFVLASSIALIIMFLFWRPIDRVIWEIQNPIFSDITWILFWAGWGTILISTFLINHFELFGLQQAWLYARGRKSEPPHMCEPMLYRFVRHPMMTGFFLAFWATPRMTAGHLLLAVGLSVYILIALRYEERDLVTLFGADYENYRARVGMLVPRFRRRST